MDPFNIDQELLDDITITLLLCAVTISWPVVGVIGIILRLYVSYQND